MLKKMTLKMENLVRKIFIVFGGLNVSHCCRLTTYELEIPKELQQEVK